MERVEGIEPSWLAWKARTLPLSYTRITLGFGGRGWIRTNVGVSQRIYSPPPLATRAPFRPKFCPAIIADRDQSALGIASAPLVSTPMQRAFVASHT